MFEIIRMNKQPLKIWKSNIKMLKRCKIILKKYGPINKQDPKRSTKNEWNKKRSTQIRNERKIN